MRTLHILFAGCLLAGALASTSCTSNFDDINTNPNKMTVGDIQASRMQQFRSSSHCSKVFRPLV